MTLADDTRAAIQDAAAAIDSGEAVVYPTETVYGLAAAATDAAAIERVFEIKGRPRDKPISVAFPDIETARQYTEPTDRERDFMEQFLPGPVTVVVERQPTLPDALTAGGPRVGVRVPDEETALALCRVAGPITATSANRSGEPSVRQPDDLSPSVREAVGAIIDTGQTPGGGSTVVDVEAGTIHRRGVQAEAIESWLADN